MIRAIVLLVTILCMSAVKAEMPQYSIDSMAATYLGMENGQHIMAYSVLLVRQGDDADSPESKKYRVINYVTYSKDFIKDQRVSRDALLRATSSTG